MRETRAFHVAAFLISFASLTAAGTITVSVHGGADFTEIQSAFDVASDGDTILVWPGEYIITESLDFNRLHDPDSPGSPPVKNLVVRSTHGPEVTTIRMSEELGGGRGSVIVFENGESEASVLEGFTLTGGKGASLGGGILIREDASPRIVGCRIVSNQAHAGGGVAIVSSGKATLVRCIISGNEAESNGGGIYCGYGFSGTFVECTVSKNTAGESGGGGYFDLCEAEVKLCRFMNNSAGYTGGGLAVDGRGSLTVESCLIAGNAAKDGWGGGVYCSSDSTPFFRKCTVAGNASARGGGGLFAVSRAHPTLLDSIVWNNAGGAIGFWEGSAVDASFCCIEGESIWPGEGNFNSAPLFCGWGDLAEAYVDSSAAPGGDGTPEHPFSDLESALFFEFSLSKDSPCLTAGSDGGPIGAFEEGCEGAGSTRRVLYLMPGVYEIQDLLLSNRVSLLGSGAESTTVHGTVFGLRSGESLSSFTVSGGRSGGVRISSGEAPEITRCVITENQGDDAGGSGVYCGPGSQVLISDCLISRNTETRGDKGTILCAEGAGLEVSGSTIEQNVGIGILCERDSRVTVRECEIRRQEGKSSATGISANMSSELRVESSLIVDGDGSGLKLYETPSVLVSDCVVEGNTGCGIRIFRSSARIRNTTISRNLSRAVEISESESSFSQCVIQYNVNTWKGEGVVCIHGTGAVVFENCVVRGNVASGGRIICCRNSSPLLSHCTIVGNTAGEGGAAVFADAGSSPRLRSCIVFNNLPGSVGLEQGASPLFTYSCIEGPQVWPGAGNIKDDPRFCGWKAGDIYVDASVSEPGEGTRDRPYRELDEALRYSLALRADSPCVGTGDGGSNMGADLGVCETGGAERTLIHLAAGTYRIMDIPLIYGASVEGAGPEKTVVEGTVGGLRTGCRLTSLTVSSGLRGGIMIPEGQKPEIISCVIRRNLSIFEGAVRCGSDSQPVLRKCVIEENAASGVYCGPRSSVRLEECTIRRNNSSRSGGGIYCADNSEAILLACTLRDNYADHRGGGIATEAGVTLELKRTVIRGNAGGAIALGSESKARLLNCELTANRGGPLCAVKLFDSASAEFVNCTFTANSEAALYCPRGATAEFLNCIVWETFVAPYEPGMRGQVEVTYSCIRDNAVFPGVGNINENPKFALSGLYSFRRLEQIDVLGRKITVPNFVQREPNCDLLSDSPAVDAGTSEGAPSEDILGRSRPFGAGIDMGAYETRGAPGPQENIIRVPQDYADIQEALNAACDGDIVVVAPGVYVIEEPLNFNLLYRPGGSGSARKKDVVLASSEGPERTVIRLASGIRPVIVFENKEGSDSRVEGFTITGGGTGISCGLSCSPSIVNCNITGNRSGIFCEQSSAPSVSECRIFRNRAAGIRIYNGSISNCEIFENGVGIVAEGSATITGCTILRNVSESDGGGVVCGFTSEPVFLNCLIAENVSCGRGGGIFCYRGAVSVFRKCTIVRNVAAEGGGGVFWSEGSVPEISECIVWGNCGGSIEGEEGPDGGLVVTYSCVQSERVWPGEGNLNSDPLFGGWGSKDTVYVDPSHPQPGEGTPDNPYATLAEALVFDFALARNSPCLTAAADGGRIGFDMGLCDKAGVESRTIHLAEGVYLPNRPILSYRVTIIGSGVGKSVVKGTILGPGTGSLLTDLTITEGKTGGIIIGKGEGPEIRRCEITGNSARRGGGILCGMGTLPQITDSTISQNHAQAGSALYAGAASRVTLARCTISGNETEGGSGGAVEAEDPALLSLSDCTVTGNLGSGIRIWKGALSVERCALSGNRAEEGGGLFAREADLELRDSLVSGNRSAKSGGGVACVGNMDRLLVEGCTFSGNETERYGGGFYSRYTTGVVEDCLFTGNIALLGGGGLCIKRASWEVFRVSHVTAAGNVSPRSGGIMTEGVKLQLVNSIVWNNTPPVLSIDAGSDVQVSYCCIEQDPAPPGQGNINDDPGFCGWGGRGEVYVDPSQEQPGDGTEGKPYRDLREAVAFDYSLSASSPCVGTGENGTNMGAALGVCETGSEPQRIVHLASGSYDLGSIVFPRGVILRGEGPQQTVLAGTLWGLGTGSALSDVSVEGGPFAGIVISGGEAPRINNCSITGGSAVGVYVFDSAPRISDCKIAENKGAGLYLENSSAELSGCTVLLNEESGVVCAGGAPEFSSCLLSGNHGTGLLVRGGGTPVLTDCRIQENSTGGLVFIEQSGGLVSGTFVTSNRPYSEVGGGIFIDNSSPSFKDCTIAFNQAEEGGGGVYGKGGEPVFDHCTIAFNAADRGGGGIACVREAAPRIASCIVWENPGGSLRLDPTCRPTITYSCLEAQELPAGEGNINSDPLLCACSGQAEIFVDGSNPSAGSGTAEDPYRDLLQAFRFCFKLSPSSPALGAGEGGSNMGAPWDICAQEGTVVRTVNVAPGVYQVGDVIIPRRMSIVGADRERTVIRGTLRGLRGGTRISGMTISGGASGGVRISESESVEFRRCAFSESSGPGVVCYGSAELNECTISDNEGDGVYALQADSLVLKDCKIESNSSRGMNLNDSFCEVTDCQIKANGEEGIYAVGGELRISDCLLLENGKSGLRTIRTIVNCSSSRFQDNRERGVQCSRGAVEISDSVITGNMEGGLSFSGKSEGMILRDSDVVQNFSLSGSGGGIWIFETSAEITNCFFERNYAYEKGGAIECQTASASFTGCTIVGNRAGKGGAVACDSYRPVSFVNCTIVGNAAREKGGAIFAEDSGVVDFRDCIIWSNGTGALYSRNAEISISYCCVQVEAGSREPWPGEGNIKDDPRFCGWGDRSTVYVDSAAPPGGDGSPAAPFNELAQALRYDLALAVDSPCIGSGFEGGTMGAPLGICDRKGVPVRTVYVAPGTYRVDILNVAHEARVFGSGASNCVIEGALSGFVGRSVLSGFTITSPLTEGMLIASGGKPNIALCTFREHKVLWDGAVLYVRESSPVFTNCIFENNEAEGDLIHIVDSGLTAINCRFTDNKVFFVLYSRFFLEPGPPSKFINCTIIGNGRRSITAKGSEFFNCLIEQAEGALPAAALHNCLVSENPLVVSRGVVDFERYKERQWRGLLRAVPDFIVEQPDYRLPPESPAIDAGSPEEAPGVDLDLHARPCGRGVDIGAYEFGGCVLEAADFSRGDANADGRVNIADAVFTLQYLFASAEEPLCLDALDSNDDSRLNLADPIATLMYLFGGGVDLPAPFGRCGPDRTPDGLSCKAFPICPQ